MKVAKVWGLSLLAASLVAGTMFTPLPALAEPARTLLLVPRGAIVDLLNQTTARIRNGGLNASGTFSCLCSGTNPKGTCVLGKGASTIICGTDGSTCNGSCKLYTTQTGAAVGTTIGGGVFAR